jgi:hypothetical protein
MSIPDWDSPSRRATWDSFWWPPRDITFTRDQVLWLIYMLPLLTEGCWPRDPNQSSIDVPGPRLGIKSFRAPFENPAMIAAEIEARLQRTGLAGRVLYYQLRADCTWGDLEKSARSALYYCCGWKRKSTSFANWKSQRHYYLKSAHLRIR